MRKLLIIFFLLLTTLTGATDYYIKTGGDDGNTGLSDGQAWLTITKLNAAWAAGTFAPGDNIYFNRGDTWTGVTLVASESGSAGSVITFSAYGAGADPIISGFTTLSSWTNEGGGIYSKAVTSAAQTNMVTVDGVQVGMGRYPDSGWKTYESCVGHASITDNTLSEEGTDWDNAEVVVKKHVYMVDRGTITSNVGDVINYTETLGSGASGTINYGYFIQNDIRCVTATNEWYHSTSSNELFIYGDPAAKTVKMATLNSLVTIGTYDYITFDNLVFEGCISNAITLNSGSTNITFQNSEIRFTGRTVFYSNSAYLTVNACNIHDINGNGIYGTFANLTFTNNILSDVTQIDGTSYGYDGTRGINIEGATSALIQYNTLEDIAYHGISVKGNNAHVYNNLIIDAVNKFMDGGAIYTSDAALAYSGLIIKKNIILNCIGSVAGTPLSAGIWQFVSGIYLDEPTHSVTVQRNSISNCLNGLKFHKTHDINVYGNIIHNPEYHAIQLQWTSAVNPIRTMDIDTNIVVVKNSTGKGIFIYATQGDMLSYGTSDYNYWARPIDDDYTFYLRYAALPYVEKTLAEWQAYSSQDANSNKSPISITDTTEIDFYYNYTNAPVIQALAVPMIDMAGTKYAANYTIPAYYSVVLLEDPDPVVAPPDPPTVTTSVVTRLPSMRASGGGNCTSDGGGTLSAVGICWNTTGSPTTADNITNDATAEGAFTSTMTGLSANTTYYVRAYATNETATAYGTEETYTIGKWVTSGGKVVTSEGKAVRK